MARQWVFWVLAAVVGFGLVTCDAQAGLVDENTAFGAATAWDGFGEDFSPEWEGQTMVVDSQFLPAWTGTQGSGTMGWTSSGCIMLAGNWNSNYSFSKLVPGHWETRKTVRKVSSSSDSRALSSAWLSRDGREFTAEKNGSDGAEMARYATLVSSEGTLLANAAAIAYKNNNFGDDSFSAGGRVSALSIIVDPPEEIAAEAADNSQLTVSSQPAVQETVVLAPQNTVAAEVPVVATGRAALLKVAPSALKVNLFDGHTVTINESSYVTLADLSSQIEIASLAPAAVLSSKLDGGDFEVSAEATGRSWFDVTYELDQETTFSLDLAIARLGEVELVFSATDTQTGEKAFSFSTVEAGTQQEISMEGILEAGTYKFALNCMADSAVDSTGEINIGGQALFDVSLDLEEEYVQVWVPDQYVSSSVALDLASVFADDSSFVIDLSLLSAVPEPSGLVLLIIGGCVSLMGSWRRGGGKIGRG